MSQLQETESEAFCRSWWQMLTSLFGCQWKLFAGQYQVGLKLMDGIYRRPASTAVRFGEENEASSLTVDQFRGLERKASERVRQGLAPPKEIYDAPYRDRIDWSQFPEWAKPTDPEVFQDCGHEG
jgi:hypothetical protein